MPKTLQVGSEVPALDLAVAAPDHVETVRLDHLFAEGRHLVFGVPGAFTPVCTDEHVPDFVRNAAALRKSGFDRLVCIAPNDPFTLDAWRRRVDPDGTLLFLSDGLGMFARALGVETQFQDHFLGRSNNRYLLTTGAGTITHLAVEQTPTLLSCTRARDVPRA